MLSENKRTIDRYMAGSRVSDHALILYNEAFVGHPEIVVTRMIEEADVVVVEGSVRTHKRDGAELRLRFCDVFVLEAGKIKQLTSYLTDFG